MNIAEETCELIAVDFEEEMNSIDHLSLYSNTNLVDVMRGTNV